MPPPAPYRCSSFSALHVVALVGVLIALFATAQPRAARGPDKLAPSAPTNLRLAESAETTFTVLWTAATDNVGVEGYRVNVDYRQFTRTKETRHSEFGLACGSSYTVEVRAYDHARNLSHPARVVVATASCLDVEPPSTPGDLRQVARGPTTATLAWQPSNDNVAVAGYALSLGGQEFERASEESFVYVGLTCGSTYAAGVRAYDVSGNESPWAFYYMTTSACGDVTAPSAPTGLVQLDRTTSSVSFAWSPSRDDVGVARYRVYSDGALVSETTALSSALSGRACATAYDVGVEAVDAAGNRSARTTAIMSTAACSQPPEDGDKAPPPVPSNLSVGPTTSSSITLTWSPSIGDGELAGYDVFRNGVRMHDAVKTSYAFAGLSCATSYELGVAAFDTAGNRSETVSVIASTTACTDSSPPSPPTSLTLLSRTSTSVTVNWAASTDDVAVAGYGAYRDGALVGSTTETTYTFTGLACGTSRTFGIDAYDAAGKRSTRTNVVLQTAACGDTQAPTTPTQLSVSNATETSLTLGWAASSDNLAVAGYDVFANGSKVATVTGTSGAIGGLACNTSYTLGVEAFDAVGNRSGRAVTTGSTAQCSPSPSPSPAPSPGGGNLYIAPNGSDTALCTQAAPCASFARAYLVAKPGNTVEVAGGTYPAQTLPADSSKTSAEDVVFQPASGASVTLGGFSAGDNKSGIGPKHFELRDLKIGGEVRVSWGTEDVTLRNIDAGVLNLTSTRDVRVLGGDFGPWVDGVSHIKACGELGCFPAEDILVDGALFHDYTITDPAKHSECLMIWPGRRVTIRNSTFRNCTDFDVLVKPYNTGLVGSPGEITFENNFFDEPMPGDLATKDCVPDCPRGGNAIAITQGSGEAWSGVRIRYNSSLGGIRVDPAVTNVMVKANVARKDSNYSCSSAEFSYNVWSGAKCSTSDLTAPMADLFVGPDSSSFDLHLKPGTVAIDAGDPADYPSRDNDGKSRPMGGAPDAGADERG